MRIFPCALEQIHWPVTMVELPFFSCSRMKATKQLTIWNVEKKNDFILLGICFNSFFTELIFYLEWASCVHSLVLCANELKQCCDFLQPLQLQHTWPGIKLSGRIDPSTHWKRNENDAQTHWKDIPISYLCVVKPRAVYLSIIYFFFSRSLVLLRHALFASVRREIVHLYCFFFLTNVVVFSSFLLQSLSWWRIIFPLA